MTNAINLRVEWGALIPYGQPDYTQPSHVTSREALKTPLRDTTMNPRNRSKGVTILLPADASPLECLAAREVRRYIYLRTAELPAIKSGAKLPAGRLLVVARKDRGLVADAPVGAAAAGLGPQEYIVKTTPGKEADGPARRTIIWIVGGDDVGTLYGAYRFAETLGVRFYLHGDVVPDRRIPGTMPDLDELGKPIFDVRGIQLYYDFPEGPDWWDQDDHLAYMAQLAKMRMNFCGFHCYGGELAEPAVWVGAPRDLDASGAVRFAYPAQWANTPRNSPWGYAPMKTGDFCAGAAALFAEDDFGPAVMKGLMPKPETPEQCIELFARTGKLYQRSFAVARGLGIKTCVGTETPLSIPALVRARLEQQGQNPDNPAIVRAVYAAMFRRIAALYPVDYYWLWTDESWTHCVRGEPAGQFEAVVKDLEAALGALESLGNPFTLALSGWVLGPYRDRAAFDKILPKQSPISCINRHFGNEPLDTGFAAIRDRPKWAIPWLENDPNLAAPQPWVGRMRYDAADAKRFGCTGLMGVLWRTKILSGNISALAMAGWDLSWVPAGFDTLPVNREPSLRVPGPQGAQASVSRDNMFVQNTDEAPVYQTLCAYMSGYCFRVPNGTYTVTLKFNETSFDDAGKRVFGVNLQGQPAIDKLDIAARAGRYRACDCTFPNIVVKDGWLQVEFVPIVDVPIISGVVMEGQTAIGKPFVKKVNCGGRAYKDYEADNLPGLDRAMPVEAFYVDFAKAHFGDEIGEAAGKILARHDGRNLPEPSWWFPGPGCIWQTRRDGKTGYEFVGELAGLRARVQGPGNLARFDYWLNTYRYMAAMAEAGDTRARLNEALDTLRRETVAAKQKKLARKALGLRVELARTWEKLMTYQLAATDTPGELGTIANLEQHNRLATKFVNAHDAEIEKLLGEPLPAATQLATTYAGPARIIVPTVRTLAGPGEALTIKVIILSAGAGREDAGASAGTLHWRLLGKGRFAGVPLRHAARRVYQVTIPAVPEQTTAIEYYIRAKIGDLTLVWPATAPTLNQTVVISALAGATT